MKHHCATNERRGSATVAALILMVGLATFSLSLLTYVAASNGERRTEHDETAAKLAAEAGIAEAIFRLRSGDEPALGSQLVPQEGPAGNFWVEQVDLGDDRQALTCTALAGRGAARIEVVLESQPNSFFTWAAFGHEGLTMDSNAHVDSYDSTLGSYDTQDVNGSGSKSYANDEGNVGSNGDIELDQNAIVWGNAVPGPDGTASVTGNADVTGTTSPSSSIVDMPAIELPAIPSAGDLTVNGGSTLGSGDHAFDDLKLKTGATLVITGPATVLTQTMVLGSNSSIVVDATNGPVEFFVVGDFVVNSNTTIASTTFNPLDIAFNLISDNVIDPDQNVNLDEVDFESNAKLYGTIYAPNAFVEINSNFELFGSLVARRVHLDSNCFIHFDEALLDAGDNGDAMFDLILWRELSVSSQDFQ